MKKILKNVINRQLRAIALVFPLCALLYLHAVTILEFKKKKKGYLVRHLVDRKHNRNATASFCAVCLNI